MSNVCHVGVDECNSKIASNYEFPYVVVINLYVSCFGLDNWIEDHKYHKVVARVDRWGC